MASGCRSEYGDPGLIRDGFEAEEMRPSGLPHPERSSLIGGLADAQGIRLYDGHLQHQIRPRRNFARLGMT